MNTWVPVFEPDETQQKRRGVTVITEHGRAVSFGVSQDRTEFFMKAVAQHNTQVMTAAMQEHKAALLQTNPPPALKTVQITK